MQVSFAVLRPLLLDASGTPGEATQVIELGAANAAASSHFDLVDARRMDEKGPLDPDPVCGKASNRKVLVDSARAPPDDDALEDLDALPVTFDDLGVNTHSVAWAERRNIWFELLRLELTNDLGNHLTPSFSLLVLEPMS